MFHSKPLNMKNLFALLLTVLGLFCIQNVQAQSAQANQDEVKVVTVKVSGVCCNGDLATLKKKLVNQEGIDEVSADDAKKEATNIKVKYHTAIISEEKIRSLIEKTEGCEKPGELPYKVKAVTYLTPQ
jgi:copper chaperone CopZ